MNSMDQTKSVVKLERAYRLRRLQSLDRTNNSLGLRTVPTAQDSSATQPSIKFIQMQIPEIQSQVHASKWDISVPKSQSMESTLRDPSILDEDRSPESPPALRRRYSLGNFALPTTSTRQLDAESSSTTIQSTQRRSQSPESRLREGTGQHCDPSHAARAFLRNRAWSKSESRLCIASPPALTAGDSEPPSPSAGPATSESLAPSPQRPSGPGPATPPGLDGAAAAPLVTKTIRPMLLRRRK